MDFVWACPFCVLYATCDSFLVLKEKCGGVWLCYIRFHQCIFFVELITGVIFILFPDSYKAALLVQLCIAGIYAVL